MGGFTIKEIEVEHDLPSILELDGSTFTSPWTPGMYRGFLANQEVAHVCVLRTGENELAGYCSYMLIVDEIHINNLAVRPGLRRRGMGAALIEHVLQAGARHGARSATLEVRRSNLAARGLYARAGFVEEGVRRNYYTAPTEDGLVLWRRGIAIADSENPEF